MHESIMHVILAMLSFKRNHTSITFKGKYKCKRLIKLPLLLYMLCDIIYMILNISSTISTSLNFVAIKSKTIADLSYVICKCSIKIWTTIHVCDFGTYLGNAPFNPPCWCSGARVCLHLHIQAANALVSNDIFLQARMSIHCWTKIKCAY